jgi:RHS repeat-associated protein
VDPWGAVVERYVYDPYGAVTVLNANWAARAGNASAYEWRYLHQGGRYEAYVGLYEFRHRDYRPSLGRWLQRDPLGFAAGDMNLYRSEHNNPVNRLDPLGLEEALPLNAPNRQRRLDQALAEARRRQIEQETFARVRQWAEEKGLTPPDSLPAMAGGSSCERPTMEAARYPEGFASAADYQRHLRQIHQELYGPRPAGIFDISPDGSRVGAFWIVLHALSGFAGVPFRPGPNPAVNRLANPGFGPTPTCRVDSRPLPSAAIRRISRGTVDLGNLKHYNWQSPSGQSFDLMLRADVVGGRLIIREAHLMPQSGTFQQSQHALGLSGLRQLQRDLGSYFGVQVIEIPGRIGRTTGRTGGFGPGVFPIH